MKRSIEKDLLAWKNKPDRKPLLIRGARQIGKTYIIEAFAKKHFESFVSVNFEEMKEAKKSFEDDLTPSLILRDLSTRLKQPIIPGKTVLFFDEIQACPNALLSLRFFKEQMPELHLIGAGSLLEFVMGDNRFSFPVGRVEYLYMRPMSFIEFLEAKGDQTAIEWLCEATPSKPVGGGTHASLMQSVKEYFIVGGMPEAISSFIQTQQFLGLDAIHQNLLNSYENDLGKYPKTSQQKFMRLLFEAAPRLVGDHFKYAKIQPHAQSRDYLESLDVLNRTGILHQVFANSAAGLPLEAQKKEKRFKLLFLDIGLLPQPIQSILDTEELVTINRGNLAEQFVGQEFVAYEKPYRRPSLYYWEREKQGSDAEVDFVIEVGSHIIPIEVKVGQKGRLRSLRQFMIEKESPLGVHISQASLSLKDQILSVPFYMIHEIPRLIEKYL
ncbi:MAG: ATP-binding protein [Verrucomicrobia bacterium]|nr:ATP-binding protein [Verrucomicrobiota bacterium]